MATQEALDQSFNAQPLYFVVFDSRASDDPIWSPITREPERRPVTEPHGLDTDLIPVLPAIRYLLGLPRHFLELVRLPLAVGMNLIEHRPEPNICLAAAHQLDEDLGEWPPPRQMPTLAIAPDNLLDRVRDWSRQRGFLLDAVSTSSLDHDLLVDQWTELYASFPDQLPPTRSPAPVPQGEAITYALPVQRLYQLFGGEATSGVDDLEGWIRDAVIALTQGAVHVSLTRDGMGGSAMSDLMETHFLPRYEAEKDKPRLRVSLGALGVAGAAPPSGSTSMAGVRDRSQDLVVERSAAEILVTRSALRDSGVGLMLRDVPPDAFRRLRDLENHWGSGLAPVPSKVWPILDRINEAASSLFTPPVVGALRRASHLTVYSNFPVGLLTLPGDSAPISCRVPITYRPLGSMTQAVQRDLTVAPLNFESGLRVLVVETVTIDDPIGGPSRAGWRMLREAFEAEPQGDSTLEVVEAASAAAVAAAIEAAEPDVLVLSAHGTTVDGGAGLAIGEHEFTLGDDLGELPPLVILSACEVMPRGSGSVTVADVLLACGATAVLGPQVPVEVERNAFLMTRFVLHMLQASRRGIEDASANVLEVWRHVQVSNAVDDVLRGSKRLKQFGASLMPNGSPVAADFVARASVDRLRANHIYDDTIDVLLEMADEAGTGATMRKVLGPRQFVPETMMYAFVGQPESLWLNVPSRFLGEVDLS